MRTFVAIDIPGEIRQRIQELIATLRQTPSDVRWSRPEGLHITLKFLGEIPAEKVDQVKLALQSLLTAEPVSINIAGAGFYPNERAPRVLWLGIEAGPALGKLAASVEQCLVSLGIPKEERPFAPHLTLGRIRSSDGIAPLRELLKQREPLGMGSFTAAEFFLYESRLAPGGSIYEKIACFPLAPDVPPAA
ncbi:MAG: RNA 2',3'-cyclic phosphodiesterase [Acidobacteria bacterium]|nr:RNA 2',3'-cyclic phosphodiesterase [Acidobacteriota bacterium]